MTSKLRPHVRSCILLFLIASVLAGQGVAKPVPRAARPAPVDMERVEAADNLAAEIREIVNSHAISRAKKEKRVSTAVRVAVVAATAYKKEPEDVLGTALELTRAASAAAPSFAEVIANAVSFAPSLARIDSAPGRIRSAAFASAKAPRNTHRIAATPVRKRPSVPAVIDEEEPAASSSVATNDEPPADRSISAAGSGESAENYPEPGTRSAHRVATSPGNTNFSIGASVSARHDNNVYLTNTGEVADTIIAVTPSIEAHFGQNSLSHGSVSYQTAFTRYADKTAPNVSLGSGGADFGYDNGAVAINGNASFQQTNQNSAEVAAIGQKSIFRKDVATATVTAEPHLTAKTSLLTGINYFYYKYKNESLVGSRETEIPFRFYYETTPKVSVSAGVAYRWVKPINGTNDGHDLDYSLGARGNFTEKLKGELSVDYRTRSVGTNPKENLWGLNGALSYEITPKTSSTLVFSRDFRTGAFGESLKNSSYGLRVNTDLTPQWQAGAGINFRKVEYGKTVFKTVSGVPLVRSDDYWEGNFQVSYLFTSWLNASADYTLRHNQSTLTGAEFSDNLISLTVGVRY